MSKQLGKYIKYAGGVLALVSLIYTGLQLIEYIGKSKKKIVATYYEYDLMPFINSLYRNKNETSDKNSRLYVTDFGLLNKYLKNQFSQKYAVSNLEDSMNQIKLHDLKKAIGPLRTEDGFLLMGRSIIKITIQNISDKEISDVKIDLSELFCNSNEYHYLLINNLQPSLYDSLNIKKAKNIDKIIAIGSLLPKQIKTATFTELESNRNGGHYPRIIFPDGYVNAFGSSTLNHSSKFDEMLTDFVVSSVFIQFLILIFTLLGAFYFIKLAMKFTKLFLKKTETISPPAG